MQIATLFVTKQLLLLCQNAKRVKQFFPVDQVERARPIVMSIVQAIVADRQNPNLDNPTTLMLRRAKKTGQTSTYSKSRRWLHEFTDVLYRRVKITHKRENLMGGLKYHKATHCLIHRVDWEYSLSCRTGCRCARMIR